MIGSNNGLPRESPLHTSLSSAHSCRHQSKRMAILVELKSAGTRTVPGRSSFMFGCLDPFTSTKMPSDGPSFSSNSTVCKALLVVRLQTVPPGAEFLCVLDIPHADHKVYLLQVKPYVP